MASSSTVGTETTVRAPERASLASCKASLRSVLTRSPGVWGDQRGCHHPAVGAFVRQRAVEPGATGAGFVDEEQMGGLRWHCAYALIDVTLAGAKSSERGDLSTMILGDRGDSHRVCVDIHADKECARLGHD